MKTTHLALFALSTSMGFAPLNAQETGENAVAEKIWGDVVFGMTRAQVEAFYPKGKNVDYQKAVIEISDVAIIDGCDAEVNVRFKNDVVDEVMIAGNPSMGGRCSEKVIAGLSSKYGEPLDTDKHHASVLARQGRVFIWNRPGGITMRFKKFTNGVFGGGGLAKASWELTYTRLGQDIAL